MTLTKKICTTGLSWLWLTIFLIAIDRYTKFWVQDHLVFLEPLAILPIFNLTLAHNTGAAFSFLHSASGWQNLFLGSLAIVISAIIIRWLYKLPAKKRWVNIALCLILAGALGNAWDRVLYGFVIDFFDFHLDNWHFAIFNVADSAIFVGAFMLMGHWLLHLKD